MTAFDRDALLAPVAEDPPCGPDRRLALERIELRQAFQSAFSINPVAPDDAPAAVDWNKKIDVILGELRKSKDLSLAVDLARAAAYAGKRAVVEDALTLLAELMRSYWTTLHPRLVDADDPSRKFLCENLADRDTFLDPLAAIPVLVDDRAGRYSAAAVESLRASAQSGQAYDSFMAAVERGKPQLVEAVESLSRIESSLHAVASLFNGQCGGTVTLSIDPAYARLAKLRKAIASYADLPPEPETAPQPGGESIPAVADGKQNFSRIESRTDVLNAMEAIKEYYTRNEPSSPVPVLIDRATEWVNSTFIEILGDISASGLEEAKKTLLNRDAKNQKQK